MHCARPSVLAGLLLLAAGVACGAEGPGGTLDATKQELQQLQSDQKNKAGQTTDKLRLDNTGIDLQLRDANSPQAWLSDKLKQERKLKEEKAAAGKNWLVEGVDKLEKENAQSKTATPANKTDAGDQNPTQAIDQSDPQYLLKLFDEQKKTTDTKSASAKSSVPAAPDPFAPFLQGWLASSPARGQFFDQLTRKPDAGIAGGAPIVPSDYGSPGPATVGGAVALHDAAATEKANPYLAELNTPILTKEMLGEAASTPALGAPLPAPEATKSGPAVIPLEPAPEARERPKAPLPGLVDEKKYFPQLKRF